MPRSFRNLDVWITGGGTGLGRALALEVAARGGRVAVSGRREDRLQETVEEILRVHGGQAIAVPCDVTDEASVQSALQSVLKSFGRVDVAVANAGYAATGKFVDLDAHVWRRQFDVNVIGLATTARLAIPELQKTKGRLALIGSIAAFVPGAGYSPYCASKAAVRSIGQSLSVELHGTGVSCTTVHPGYVESEISKVDARGEYKAARKDRRPQSLLWKSDKAATEIANAILRRKREHIFTAHGRVAAFLGKHMSGAVHLASVNLPTSSRRLSPSKSER